MIKTTISSIIIRLSKVLVAFIAIYAMVFQPLMQSFDATESLNYELVDIEKESDKTEENTDKDEKIKLQFLSFYDADYQINTKLKLYSYQESKRDFVLEIPIPPPDSL